MDIVAILCMFVVVAGGLALGVVRVVDASKNRMAPRRSRARAAEVAQATGALAEQDGEIPTTWRIRVADGSLDATLWMGSPAVFDTPVDDVVDWMKVSAAGPRSFPVGARVRPPTRTHSQWRDGDPGEAPSLVTPRGVRLVVEPGEDGAQVDIAALTAWVDAFDAGIWLVTLSRETIELRADAPATRDPVRCARRLFELVRSAP
jgi:hypothetical protein